MKGNITGNTWDEIKTQMETDKIMMTGKTKYGQGNTRQRETDCDRYTAG